MTLGCRVYLLCERLGILSAVQQLPVAKRPLNRLLGRLLPDRPEWVQVRSGFGQGLWMQLNLRKEARFWLGEHEPSLQTRLIELIRPGMNFYDIGAHVGSIALGSARAVGESGRVVAFEADPDNAKALMQNRERNGLEGTLDVVASAVWSSSSSGIEFRQGGEKRSHGGVEAEGLNPVLGSGDLIRVPTISLDDFVADGGPIPQLIKIDVEGAEYEVLRGAEQLFKRHRPFLVSEVHHKAAEYQIREWLHRIGYSSRWIAPVELYPCCVFAWAEESLKGSAEESALRKLASGG